jgi:vacuolar iron transporter family protein
MKFTKSYNWVPDFVYGGIDGAVTTFAVVAGVAGAQLSTTIVLILGFANLFADGFSMAVSKYSSDHTEKERIQRVREKVDKQVHDDPKSAKKDLEKVMKGRGFKGKELATAVRVMSSNESVWVDSLMRHKYHLIEENIDPVKGGLATFIAFNVIGFIPLASFVVNEVFNLNLESVFGLTICFTLFALFTVGAVKAKLVEGNWLKSGLETMVIGGAAASIAYLVGYLLRNIA